ncbi:MAG TPA: helix-turn-helix domain-containing protein [Victivallales bacterium]|nr:helix-turn-helix domain-containing protein [Victivallales bacterium]
MLFYNEKCKEIRKLKKFRLQELADKLEINRSTLWLWENGRVVPSEKKIRILAKTLDVSLEMISDIKPEIEKSDTEFGRYKEVISSWISSSERDLRAKEKQYNKCFEYLRKQLKESNQTISIARTIINFSDIMFYIKDINQNYIAASKSFLHLIGLSEEKNIIDKDDFYILPRQEAKNNLKEDEAIVHTGKALRNKEALIPGSRKKKWGIISKIPTFDSDGRITGLIGSFIDITERKQNEIIIERFKKALSMMEEAIWVGEKARQKNNGRITIDNFLYSVDDKLRKALMIEDKNLTSKELWDYADSLIIDEDKEKKIKLKDLLNKKETEIRLKLKLPNEIKLIYVKIRTYYDSNSGIFVWIATEDTENKKIECIRQNLKQIGMENKLIEKVLNAKLYG